MPTQPYLPKSQPRHVGWCGPTALANALALYGIPSSPEECAGACQVTDITVGARAEDMIRGLKRFGFRALARDIRDSKESAKLLRWVQKQTSHGKLVICGINGNYNEGHWILILGVTPPGVHVWDPNEDASKIVTRKNLYAAWWCVTSPEDPDQSLPSQIWLAAMSPRTKLARRAVEIRANLLNPPPGELPTDKAVPDSFEDEEKKKIA